MPPLPDGFMWGRADRSPGTISVSAAGAPRWVAYGDPAYWGGFAAIVGAHRMTQFRRVFDTEAAATLWIARWTTARADVIRAELEGRRVDPTLRLGYGPRPIPWQRGGVRKAPFYGSSNRR
jgi:hypothetical protein